VALGAPLHSPVLVTHCPEVVLQTLPGSHCESDVHLPHVLGPPPPQTFPWLLVAQSAFVQQSPGTQMSPQQKSAALALQAVALALQVAVTQAPVDGEQMVAAP
jgi:hypothetical protein